MACGLLDYKNGSVTTSVVDALETGRQDFSCRPVFSLCQAVISWGCSRRYCRSLKTLPASMPSTTRWSKVR